MTSSSPTASTKAAAQNAVAPRPRGPTRAQQLNKLYSLPAPLRTFPLPTLVPHNPLSIFHVIYTWFSQTYNQPKSHPETPYQGWFSPETRSVHVTDPRSARALWEQGFYGKGNLSRSEPSWHDREKRRKGAKASQTSEEVTRARRAERQQVKWERARKEREAIDQTLSEERKQTEVPAKQDDIPKTLSIRDSAIDMSSVAVEAMIPAMDDVVSEVEQILSADQATTDEVSSPAEPISPVDVTPEPQEPVEQEDVAPIVEPVTVVEEIDSAVGESVETISVVEDIAPLVDESAVAEATLEEQGSIESHDDSLLAEEPQQPAAEEVTPVLQEISIEPEIDAVVAEQEPEQSIPSLQVTETDTEPVAAEENLVTEVEHSDHELEPVAAEENLTTVVEHSDHEPEPVVAEEDLVTEVEHADHEPEPMSNEPSVVDEPEPEMTEVDPLTASAVLSGEPTIEVEPETVESDHVEEVSIPEATPKIASEEPVPTHTYQFNAAPVLATEIIETVEQVIAPVEEIPEPSPLVKVFMAACEKRGCPIIPAYAAQALAEHDNKLVPAVIAVTRNYDPALMNIAQVIPSPPVEPEIEAAVEPEVEVETIVEPEVQSAPASPATAPVDPVKLLALPNSFGNICDVSIAVESTKSAEELDEHVPVVRSHDNSNEDSYVEVLLEEFSGAPVGPLELLALPNSNSICAPLDEVLEDEVTTDETQLTTEDIDASTEAVEVTEKAIEAGDAVQETVETATSIQDEDVEVAAEFTEVAAEAVEAVEMAIETVLDPPVSLDDEQASAPVDAAQESDITASIDNTLKSKDVVIFDDAAQDVQPRSANSGTLEDIAAIDEATEDQANCEQTAPHSSNAVDLVQEVQATGIDIPATEVEAVPSSPKSPKTVRFSPKIEETTFIKESPPSPELAAAISKVDDISVPESDVAIVDKEHLQLTLEETFFLAYGLGVLTVFDPETKQPMTIPELFDSCRAASYYPPLEQPISGPDDPFLLNYVVYHHFRSLGWVVRGGTKFSVDFLLYNRGPPFSHAEFAVVVMPSYSEPYWTENEGLQAVIAEKEKRSWHWLHCINRVNSQVKKTVVLVYVDIPPPAPEPVEDAMGIDNMLKRYKIRELVMKRWLSNRSRD